jgi:hypothetical protein
MVMIVSRAMSTTFLRILAAGLVLPAVSALAHHSAAMFEEDRTIELNGTVREFQWTNPHIWIQLNVTNERGAMEEWSVEGGVPNRLFRAGWRPTSFKPGDEVSIVVRPMIDGGKAGIFVGAKLADGSVLGRFPESY